MAFQLILLSRNPGFAELSLMFFLMFELTKDPFRVYFNWFVLIFGFSNLLKQIQEMILIASHENSTAGWLQDEWRSAKGEGHCRQAAGGG